MELIIKRREKINLPAWSLFMFFTIFTLYNCGGPKKIIFNINGQIQKPQDIPQEEYQRIFPVISKIAVNIFSEVKDEDGNTIEKKTTRANINDDKISARIDFTVEDLSQSVNIKVDSQRLIIFSKDIFSDKFEKIEDIQYCKEGDIDRDGYDYMCAINFSVIPNVSDSIRNYIEFRDRLSKAEEKQFCSVYITVSQEINNIQAEIREIALSDISDIYNMFVDRIRSKANDVFSKIKNRDCSERNYLEGIKDYFCLPEKIINDSKKMIQTCDAYNLYDEGYALLKKGQTTRALDKFRESIRIKPDFSDSYIAIGDIYFEEKRYEDARDMYRKAIDIGENSLVYEKLGDTYIKMNLFEAADEAYRKAIDLLGEKASHSLFYKRAFALKKLSKWEQASEPAKRAIDTINSTPEIKYDREMQKKLAIYQTLIGEIYLNLRRFEEAKRTLEEAIKIDPYEDEALLLLAQIYSESENKSDLKKAKEYYEKLFTLDSSFGKSGDTWFKYAILLENLMEDETQIALALEKSIRFSPNNDEAYLKLAKIYEKRKGYEKVAEEMYKKAYENSKEQNRSSNFNEYISFLIKQGNYAVAKKILSEYIAKNPDDKSAKRLYNESNIMLYAINPQSLKKLGLGQKSLDEVYSAFSSIPDNIASEIFETVGVSKDFFLRVDPYKKMILIIAYMDSIYGTSGKGSELQKSEKYKELFGKNLSQATINALSKLSLQKIGIELK